MGEYLDAPPRTISLVLGRFTHLLAMPNGQAMTIYLAEFKMKAELQYNDVTKTFDERDRPLTTFPLSQLSAPGQKWPPSLRCYPPRSHRPESYEMNRWYAGQTVDAFLSGPQKGVTQQHAAIAEWRSLAAANAFMDPHQSSVRSWVPDDAWQQGFVRPLRDLKDKGIVTNVESWTLVLHRHAKSNDESAYEKWKEMALQQEAIWQKVDERRAKNKCCIL